MLILLVIIYSSILVTLCIRLLSCWYFRKTFNILISTKPQPKTCIIVTHYGWDANIERNFHRVLDEARAVNAQVIAVTQYNDHLPDMSYKFLKNIESYTTYLKVLIADNVCHLNVKRSQKCQNLLCALQHIGDEIKIIIFVDNDANLPEKSVEIMSKKLFYSEAISATGSRFYSLQHLSFQNLLVSAWINIHHLLQKAQGEISHWGGFCAFKNNPIFVQAFCDLLSNSISDDMSLNILVRNFSGKTILIDEAVATTQVKDFTWSKLFEFTNRQSIIAYRSQALKIMLPGFFLLAILPLAALFMFCYNGILAVFMWFLISIPLCVAVFSFPNSIKFLPKRSFLWLLFLPFSFLLMGWNAMCSLCSSEIQWAGIRYRFNKKGFCLSVERV